MPMAMPTRAGSSPPGNLRASSANTGSTRNRPSMRAAKIMASEPLARRSRAVMRPEAWGMGEAFTERARQGAGGEPATNPAFCGIRAMAPPDACRRLALAQAQALSAAALTPEVSRRAPSAASTSTVSPNSWVRYPARSSSAAGAAQHGIAGEGAQQLVVAGARLVRAADDGIDHAQARAGADALVGDARARRERCRPLPRAPARA